MLKIGIAILVIGALGTAVMVLVNYNQMSEQISVRPWEGPALMPPEGAVAIDSDDTLYLTREEASGLENPYLEDILSVERGLKAYNSYCLACHGENLDGFGPVGPSLPAKIKPLNGPEILSYTDGEIYWHMNNGGEVAPPMGLSMTARERWDVINFMRSKALPAPEVVEAE